MNREGRGVRVVLVRPRNPLNIGAAARAMANFGFTEMAVVKPYAPVWRETLSAPGAEDVVKQARVFASVDEALADCTLVLGTTAIRERRVERPVVALPDLGAFLKENADGRIAVMFGPEKTGLSGAYLERCHAWLTVPTDARTPSMNLSHAVAVTCYELARALGALAPTAVDERDALSFGSATVAQRNRLVRHARELIDAAGYLDFLPAAEKTRKLRRTFLGWTLRRRDVALMHGMFRFLLKALKKTS